MRKIICQKLQIPEVLKRYSRNAKSVVLVAWSSEHSQALGGIPAELIGYSSFALFS
jgi:hypothetical protein